MDGLFDFETVFFVHTQDEFLIIRYGCFGSVDVHRAVLPEIMFEIQFFAILRFYFTISIRRSDSLFNRKNVIRHLPFFLSTRAI